MGIKIGMIGLGAFGSGFADLFMSHPAVDSIALCDVDPERIKQFTEKASWQKKIDIAACNTSIDEFLKTDMDAVVVMTQPWLHAPQCIQVLESGKSVYSAVPLIRLPDGDEILDWCVKLRDAVEKSGRHYMLGETTCFRPQATYCRKKYLEGAFGKITHCEGEYFHDFNDLWKVQERRFTSNSGKPWADELEAYRQRGISNSTMFYPTHSISGPMYVTGNKPVKVSCFGQKPLTEFSKTYFDKYNFTFANMTAMFQMDDGSSMRIIEHREASVSREMFRIYGTQASFEGAEKISILQDLWTVLGGKDNKERTEKLMDYDEMFEPLPEAVDQAWQGEDFSSIYGGHGGSHPYLVNEFIDSVVQNRRPEVDVWDACRYMAAGVTANKSAMKDGEPLIVPDFGDAKD